LAAPFSGTQGVRAQDAEKDEGHTKPIGYDFQEDHFALTAQSKRFAMDK